jgi:aryl-alcohol dehydrogenase-like predicted oxidoreductase
MTRFDQPQDGVAGAPWIRRLSALAVPSPTMAGMEQRTLGRTGLIVSALGFGCGSVGGLFVRGEPTEQREAVARALDAGITYFDTAPSYGDGRSEENLGRVLGELGAWDRVVVGTKVRLSKEERADAAAAIRRSVERSLRRLGRDSVDLLQLHNRVVVVGGDGDGALPVDEVLGRVAEGLRQVVVAGLARHAGFTGIGEVDALARVTASGAFATVQSYFNAANPSAGYAGTTGDAHDFAGLIDTAAAAGLGVIAIRVLAAGALSGSPERASNASGIPGTPLVAGGDFAEDIARAQRLVAVAERLGLESSLELGLRFALAKPGVSTALVGYSSLGQLDDAIRWAERGPLSEDAVRQVLAAATAGMTDGGAR